MKIVGSNWMNHVTHHVVMPFSREEHIPKLKECYGKEGVIWHPICQKEFDFGNEDWIRPFYCKVPKYWDGCYFKLNAFNDIVDTDYYCFLCDDDLVVPGYFDRLRKHRGEVVISEAAMPQPIVPADSGWMRIGACTLAQLTVRGNVYKTMMFTNEFVGDGRMIEWLMGRRKFDYAPECRVLHNRLLPGRWVDDEPAHSEALVKIAGQAAVDDHWENVRLSRFRPAAIIKEFA